MRTGYLPVSAASSRTALPIRISARAGSQPKQGSRCAICRSSASERDRLRLWLSRLHPFRTQISRPPCIAQVLAPASGATSPRRLALDMRWWRLSTMAAKAADPGPARPSPSPTRHSGRSRSSRRARTRSISSTILMEAASHCTWRWPGQIGSPAWRSTSHRRSIYCDRWASRAPRPTRRSPALHGASARAW